ncbi:MAG: hypothetical protein EPO08_15825 [Rhodospirillaceae bacterium]|nr:MAG: hypothetical protein EPO08_15825 [Rhodospirillaceae bacterium]
MFRLPAAVSTANRSIAEIICRVVFCVLPIAFGVVVLCPEPASACACGCGVFDVGTASMFPTGTGGFAYLEYEFLNQDRNWNGTSRAPAADNDDKDIKTHFLTAGLNYTFNHSWGIQVQLPYWERYFKTTDSDTGTIVSFDHGSIGDVRLMGVYTGFSGDMSTGVRFGLKLPTGDHTYPGFDRDTEIGTGSTDALLGAYHMGRFASDSDFSWFIQVMWDQPFADEDHYRPGAEINGTLGLYYEGWTIGDKLKISPVLQVLGSHRAQDSGANSNRPNSGYDRVLISPGLEFNAGSYKVNVDVGIPAYQNMIGNQLTAPEFIKLVVGYNF